MLAQVDNYNYGAMLWCHGLTPQGEVYKVSVDDSHSILIGSQCIPYDFYHGY